MHRNLLNCLLSEYAPGSPDQEKVKEILLKFVQENNDCFERTLLKGHVTASAWLLSNDLQKMLLMHHKKLNMWVQLGGHCDGNPDVLAVAIQEAQEESGILQIKPVFKEIFDLDIHRIQKRGNEPEHYHYDVRFLLKVESDEQIQQNEESNELKWFSLQERLPSNEESLLRMRKKWVDYVGYFDTIKL